MTVDASTPLQSPSGPDEITHDGAIAPPDHGVEQLSTGTLVSRYLILGRIGAGAMGIVYAAYDPELDRKIALKLLHARGSANLDARARLLREAKSLARLSHPNVVAVHDVGTYGAHIFLAMEFVAGRTLTTWLKDQPRQWPEIVAVLARAGEGLAAAHDAGLVHRDFKPDNVLIGDDGRVRVLDFGLARAATDAPDSITDDPDALAALASASSSVSRSRESEHEQMLLTRTGALVGTPAYMSPEQHLGQPADALSDQFSFCVALYQALYRVRPFTGAKMSALAFQIIQGKVEPAPAGSQVPAWLRKVVVRGLGITADQRHPSMRALLAALQPVRAARRGGLAVVTGLTGLGLGLGVWLAFGPTAEPQCQGAALKLAGVWDDARVAEIERAFRASTAPYAMDTWHSTRTGLSAYAEKWKAAYHDACADTRIRGEQSEASLDLRMRCLDRHLGRLAALSNSLVNPSGETIEHAPEAIPRVGDVEACKDAEALASVVQLPENREKIPEIEATIAEASAKELAAELETASELSLRAANAAADLPYPPLEAEARLVHARIQRRLGNHDAATASFAAAIDAAARGRDDPLAATAWIDLVYHTAFRPDENRLSAYTLAAEAAIVRGGEDVWLRACLNHAVASVLVRLGHYEPALVRVDRALSVFKAEPTHDPVRLNQALNTLANIHRERQAFDEAQHAFEAAIAGSEAVFGAAHPAVAVVRQNFAELALQRDDVEGAERLARAAAEVFQKTLPPGHPNRAESARLLGHVAEARGDLEGTKAHYEAALEIYRAQPDVDPMLPAGLANDLGMLADKQGDLELARTHYREALAVFRRRFGAANTSTRIVENNLAEISLALDEPAASLEIADRLIATAPIEPPLEPAFPYYLCLRAQALLALGRTADALEPAKRAVELLDSGEAGAPDAIDAIDAAIVRVTLARVWAAEGVEPERQRVLLLLAEPVLRAEAADNTAAQRALAAATALSAKPKPPKHRPG